VERTISERISEAAAHSLAGRHDELSMLARAIEGDGSGTLVVFVYGPGGIGKTRVVRAALAAAPADVRIVALDCRDAEPTPGGFLSHLAAAVGMDPGARDAEAVSAALGRGAERVALALDTYESFGLLDAWLRQTFLPLLPDHVVTIISGRDAPKHGWLTTPGLSELVELVELRPLRHADAVAMLRARGLSELQAARTNRFTRGHPLALELAAAAARADPDLLTTPGRPPPSEVIMGLLDVVCSSLEPDTRELLEAACAVRRVNEPILRALVPDASAREAFRELEQLPFVERRPQGLLVHDVVRDAIAHDLAERDPELLARHRRAAARYFQTLAAEAAGDRLWEVTHDLVFMLRNPYVRECCFPTEANDASVERADLSDDAAIRAIACAHEPPPAAALTIRWWERHPETFRVARSPDSPVAAFYCLVDAAAADPELLASDPVAAAWCAHLEAESPAFPGRVLMLRRWLGETTGELPSPAVAACWLSLKRVYMEMRPDLARLYSVIVDIGELAPIFVPLGFGPCGEAVRMGEVDHLPVALDFGPRSVDGWLAGLIDAELAREPDGGDLGDGASVADLSAREREVLLLLAQGASNREIGDRPVISDRTAGRHVANIFGKLGVHSRAEAARIAAESGLTADRS
jgi:DNA-binding CsgD family transcriptional regulator